MSILLTLIIIIQLLLLQILTIEIYHQCLHNDIPYHIKPKKQHFLQKGKKRALQLQEWEPIRITFDYSSLENLQDKNITNFLKRQANLASKFFSDTLQVKRIQSNNTVPSDTNLCQSAEIPEFDSKYGIQNSDLHIYITHQSPISSKSIAWATACILDDTLRRPIFGQINFNIEYIKEYNFKQNDVFEFFTEVILHEITHVLGFSQGLYKHWIEPETGKNYEFTDKYPIESFQIDLQPIQFLTTPKVKEFSQIHYNCSDSKGIRLENNGGRGSQSSHWEIVSIENEYMTPEIITHDAIFSNFTFALLEDTGWYLPTYKYIDHADWGKNQSCKFQENCNNTLHREFQQSQDNQKYSCNFYHNAVQNNKLQNPFSDQCNLPEISSRICNGQGHADTKFTGENFTQYSRCFQSDLQHVNLSNQNSEMLYNYYGNVRCLQYECNQQGEVLVIVDGESYQINNETNSVLITPKGSNKNFTGRVVGPDDKFSFCNTYPKPCKNYCSKNGYCLGGKCHCFKEWIGIDCSIQCSQLNITELKQQQEQRQEQKKKKELNSDGEQNIYDKLFQLYSTFDNDGESKNVTWNNNQTCLALYNHLQIQCGENIFDGEKNQFLEICYTYDGEKYES